MWHTGLKTKCFLGSLVVIAGLMAGGAGSVFAKGERVRYIERDEAVYSWSLKSKQSVENVTIYHLLLKSQTWQDIQWTHQLSLVVPEKSRDTDTALLFITGGGNENGQPKRPSLTVRT